MDPSRFHCKIQSVSYSRNQNFLDCFSHFSHCLKSKEVRHPMGKPPFLTTLRSQDRVSPLSDVFFTATLSRRPKPGHPLPHIFVLVFDMSHLWMISNLCCSGWLTNADWNCLHRDPTILCIFLSKSTALRSEVWSPAHRTFCAPFHRCHTQWLNTLLLDLAALVRAGKSLRVFQRSTERKLLLIGIHSPGPNT